MAFSKYKTEIMALIYECFYMTLQKIGLSKSIRMLMQTIPNLFQTSIFLLTKLFSTQDQEYHSPLISILIVTPPNNAFLNIVLNFQITLVMTNRSKSFVLQNSSNTYSTLVPCTRNCHITNLFNRT